MSVDESEKDEARSDGDPSQKEENPLRDVTADGATDSALAESDSDSAEKLPHAESSSDATAPSSSLTPTSPQVAKKRLWFGLRDEVSTPVAILAGLFAVALVGLAWWWTTRGAGEERIFGYLQLPSISETYDGLEDVLDPENRQSHLWDNTIVSLKRVVVGFGLAVLFGVPIGILAGCFPLVRSFFAPLVIFGRNIPIAALMPLVLAMFGTGENQKYMFIFIACVAFIIADTIDAVNEVAHRYVETALTLGASRMQIVWKVLMPLALPVVCNSLRVLFGLAFGYIMLVECLRENLEAGGLGSLLNIARRKGLTHYTMIIILTIPLVAYIIDQILYVAQCWLFRWKYGKEAERSVAFRLSRQFGRLFWKAETT